MTIILKFNESSTKFEVPLRIIDDDVLENDEEFAVLLELMDATYDGRVMLQPNISIVTILDNDSQYTFSLICITTNKIVICSCSDWLCQSELHHN